MSDQLARDFTLALTRSKFWEAYRSLFFADFDISLASMEDWR
jgi:hypothetical protein